MDQFLARSSFSGPSIGADAAGESFVGQATFNGCVVFSNWPRPDVDRLLPPELELAPNASSTPDVHPVVFVFGDQTEGATTLGGVTFAFGIAYQELGMAVPFVKHRRGRYLHNYVPRMYSSYFPPIWTGNVHYGFSKRPGKMRWDGPMYVLTTDEDELLLHAAVEPSGRWSHGTRCDLPNFRALCEVFSLPVVGCKDDGTYVCSYFDWDFTAAMVRPADSYVSLDASIVSGVTPRRCDDVPGGTFEVRGMRWRLSWPTPCRF